jgi:CRISPR/Cas system-associated protein Cas7 (RAMP superfamily)
MTHMWFNTIIRDYENFILERKEKLEKGIFELKCFIISKKKIFRNEISQYIN